jgi:hypothetical protein
MNLYQYMNKTVVILTPELYYKSISNGFNSLGWNTIPLLYGIIDQNSFLNKILWKINPSKQHIKSFNKKIAILQKNIIEEQKPDFILVIKGNKLSQDSEKILMSIKIPIALWTIDSVERIENQAYIIKYAQQVFFQDGADTKMFPGSNWLPFGYDDKIFYPKYAERKYDILFIGYLKLPFYKTRLWYLKTLIDSSLSDNYKIGVVGTTGNIESDKMLHKKLSEKNIEFLGKKPLEEYAELIQNSRVCINIHQDDGTQPINPMFFAIGACKTCQIAEDYTHLNKWLIMDVDYCSVNKQNFIIKLESLLKDTNNMNSLIENSYSKVNKRDSFKGRAKYILTKLGYLDVCE